jgi:hypothetical protein
MLPSHPIATLMLEDLRAAARYLDQLTDEPPPHDRHAAHIHAVRLWAAVDAVERLVIGIEALLVQEHAERREREVTPRV